MSSRARASAAASLRALPFAACLLALWPLSAQAQGPHAATPQPLRLRVERCPASTLDAEAFLRVLRVELRALGVAEATGPSDDAALAPSPVAPGAELRVTLLGCAAQVTVQLMVDGRLETLALDPAQLPALGLERALALLAAEHVQRHLPGLSASAAQSPGTEGARAGTTEDASEPEAAARQHAPPVAPAAATQHASRVGAGAGPRASRRAGVAGTGPAPGAISAGLRLSAASPLSGLALGVDGALSRGVAFGGLLGWRREHDARVNDTDAHALTLGPKLELGLLSLAPLELHGGVSLTGGVAWIVTDRAGSEGGRTTSSPEPLALLGATLALRAMLSRGFFLQTGGGADLALLGARFRTARGRVLADVGGARLSAFVGAGAHFGG